jgi:outer membrane protein W
VGFDYSRTTTSSEVREFVDEFDLPITQQTRLSQLPLTGSLRFFPAGKGRQVGQYAWIARRVAPYIGAGGGVTWYRFRQWGEFVDFRDLIIFADDLTSDGWAPTLQVLGGVEINLSRRLAVAVEARYHWADADLGPDFTGFDPIDLSGLQTTGGLLIRF